jgi:hypothetical protein
MLQEFRRSVAASLETAERDAIEALVCGGITEAGDFRQRVGYIRGLRHAREIMSEIFRHQA